MKLSTAAWLAAVILCVALGIGLETAYTGLPLRPRHFGWYLAVGSLIVGLLFGIRGAALPPAGIMAFGAAALFNRQPRPPGAEDQTALIAGVFWIYFPLMFGALGALGALVRALGRLAIRSTRA